MSAIPQHDRSENHHTKGHHSHLKKLTSNAMKILSYLTVGVTLLATSQGFVLNMVSSGALDSLLIQTTLPLWLHTDFRNRESSLRAYCVWYGAAVLYRAAHRAALDPEHSLALSNTPFRGTNGSRYPDKGCKGTAVRRNVYDNTCAYTKGFKSFKVLKHGGSFQEFTMYKDQACAGGQVFKGCAHGVRAAGINVCHDTKSSANAISSYSNAALCPN